ncbi:MAG TPA: GNAT family N-acetyltransferase [Rugosimonospora sp.]|nr:GNAT family N-acetyltransferase [Rugosimonospora sp.]
MAAVLRVATADDAEEYTALRLAVTPHLVQTAAGLRHAWRHASPASHLLVLVAEDGGRLVGAGRVAMNTWTSEEGAAAAMVCVHPEHRGRGVGGRIYAELAEHLRAHGARRVQGWAMGDDGTARWCERRGYRRTHQGRISRLDLTAALPPVPPVPAGVRVASYAEVGPEAVYAVDLAAIADEPGAVRQDTVPFGEWHDDVWARPETDREASTVVLVDGVPAAITTVEADRATGRMWSGGTGTVRAQRGRGLAKLAKSVAVRRAAQRGVSTAFTNNDETNGPMLAINEWLGYRPFATTWTYLTSL